MVSLAVKLFYPMNSDFIRSSFPISLMILYPSFFIIPTFCQLFRIIYISSGSCHNIVVQCILTQTHIRHSHCHVLCCLICCFYHNTSLRCILGDHNTVLHYFHLDTSWRCLLIFDRTHELYIHITGALTVRYGLYREKLQSCYLRSQLWLCLVEEAVVKLKLSLVYVRWLSRKYTNKRRKNMMIMTGSLYTKLWESMGNTDFIYCMELLKMLLPLNAREWFVLQCEISVTFFIFLVLTA